MSISLSQLDQVEVPEIATTIRNAGVSGAGGAGFPTYAKWERLDEVDHLLVNHQESEPNYYIDKWLGQERADRFAELFDALLDSAFETVVVTPKHKDRVWNRELETATDATVYMPEDLPIDADEESGVVFAYTEDRYEYGMESVVLRIVASVTMGGDELPMDYGWIVQNTETLWDIYRTFVDGEPVTRKYIHVDGNVPEHRFLEVPIGTPASRLLEAAGASVDDLSKDEMLLDGGPGWCFPIEAPPADFGVTKRTNCLTVLDADAVTKNTLGDGRVNVINSYDWEGNHETEPTRVDPDFVRISMITNPLFEGVVERSQPIVGPGDYVEEGEMIATPAPNGISNTHHASIDGEVIEVGETHIEILNESIGVAAKSSAEGEERGIYWTWCIECGSYRTMPEPEHVEGTEYVCSDCR
ncbi:NADH dehydrogenase subunit [Natrinema sp. SYSU A 869]|uniref:NADH dehydrogenase subunit n=1 Tax=Natrinema sp. SYSU A 869 TaxID=2871694 RepID=UPI001CA3BEAD|nr:NADH dehydrogenase subunit [Natrinema sp. SYSU A 869]